MRRYRIVPLGVTLLLSLVPLVAPAAFAAILLASWPRDDTANAEVSAEIGAAILVGTVMLPLLAMALIGWYHQLITSEPRNNAAE